jgi:predicted glycoside hydrolase/deacetylase ChbG (UPF0249 family)
MKHRIVFNADDLGLCPRSNEGAEQVLATGLVREVSVLVAAPEADAGAALARRYRNRAGVGLHLAFTQGRSLTGRIPGLTDRQGRFLPLRRVFLSCRAGRPPLDAVRREVEAQLDRLAEYGLPAEHLDGHHHVHTLPVIRDAVAAVVRERGIRWIRVPDESGETGGRLSLKRRVLSRLARGLARTLDAAGAETRSLPFVGLSLYSRTDYAVRFERVISHLPGPDVEWMLHARTGEPALAAELALLSEPGLPGRLADRGIALAGFRDLDADQHPGP